MQKPDTNSEENLGATPRFVTELKRAWSGPDLFIPGAVDDSILLAARRRLTAPTKTFWPMPRILSWLGTATAIVLVAIFAWIQHGSDRGRFTAQDVNRDGKTDILDALIVAKAIQSGGTSPGSAAKVGHFTQADLSLIVTRAVELEKGGG